MNYRIKKVIDQGHQRYIIQHRCYLFLWCTIKENSGYGGAFPVFFNSVGEAQARITIIKNQTTIAQANSIKNANWLKKDKYVYSS